MPATLTDYQRDPWHNAGAKYIKTGVTRGTTTSTGVFTVDTLFPRQVTFALAYDEATHLRVTQTGGGPAQTMSTFFQFVPITVNPNSPTVARFRVIRQKASGDNNSTFTLGSTLTAVTARWMAVGW